MSRDVDSRCDRYRRQVADSLRPELIEPENSRKAEAAAEAAAEARERVDRLVSVLDDETWQDDHGAELTRLSSQDIFTDAPDPDVIRRLCEILRRGRRSDTV